MGSVSGGAGSNGVPGTAALCRQLPRLSVAASSAGDLPGRARWLRFDARAGRSVPALLASLSVAILARGSLAKCVCSVPSAALNPSSWQLRALNTSYLLLFFPFFFPPSFSFVKTCLNQQGSFFLCSVMCDTVFYIRVEIEIICEMHEGISGFECSRVK